MTPLSTPEAHTPETAIEPARCECFDHCCTCDGSEGEDWTCECDEYIECTCEAGQ
jgi:hypothetical protein